MYLHMTWYMQETVVFLTLQPFGHVLDYTNQDWHSQALCVNDMKTAAHDSKTSQ